MRTKAMERFGDTRKRKDEDNVSEKKKLVNRRSSSDTLIFLKEKLEYDKENKRLEREQVAHAQVLSRQQFEIQQQQHNAMLQQMIAIMAQQNTILNAFLNK